MLYSFQWFMEIPLLYLAIVCLPSPHLLGNGEEWSFISLQKVQTVQSRVNLGDPGLGFAMEICPKFNPLVCPTFAQEEGSGTYSW